MTNQYMTKLYHDLLSNSPQTVTIDIPADMGTGQISQVVTKQGAVVSDWKMNYFSGMCFMLTFRLFVSWFRSSGAAPTI